MVARQRNELEILYGLNHDGDAITDELSNTKTNVMLITGYWYMENNHLLAHRHCQKGGDLLNGILTSLLNQVEPQDLKIIMVDKLNKPKDTVYDVYKSLSSTFTEVIDDEVNLKSSLENLMKEIHNRYDYYYYNQLTDEIQLPEIIFVIHELEDVIKNHQNEIEEIMQLLNSIGDGLGIHVVMSTNNKNAHVLTPNVYKSITKHFDFILPESHLTSDNNDFLIIEDNIETKAITPCITNDEMAHISEQLCKKYSHSEKLKG